ncbi:hypothetical protein L2E82_44758 [Cichorium intybus]|uniref:Uncharacterized protein n=1 Tax=Cichorium intybus TaxID=13427 RepID=A0ACB8ZS03_CICIN|nr:hypothetical protein L2E82_44758 [Cichorium intybus]
MKMCSVKNSNVAENGEQGLIKDDDTVMKVGHGDSGVWPCSSDDFRSNSGQFPCKSPADNITVEVDDTSDNTDCSPTGLPHESSPMDLAQEKEVR